ncbi:hypothetical protein [Mesorhizobium australicum]|uniref:Uncharacterized protein n=1 Tax=Mesorhizobium australicum TaxID=536018 RepID=A0A1X7NV94_9HYPH|nr:hypothetical protein [Mesorhizobium australicum]SMH42233.1 hypothetical protein SAMN02982922_2718 [Mesorhizobium australicum]
MKCECIKAVNEKLAARNTRLALTITLTQQLDDFPTIATEQIDKGRGKLKAVSMIPTFCPFCGVKCREEG